MRAFFGLPVPEEQREVLGRYVAACASLAPAFRWVVPANLHLTVRFVGSVDRELVDGIAGRLAALQLQGFELELADLGTFQRGRMVRVVWVGLGTGTEPAIALAARVDAECVAAGLEPEGRAFQPHLTLARARGRDGDVLPTFPPPPRLRPWRARELVLFQSHLGRSGAVYEPLRVLLLD
ncbi:MAG: RNA 2',3'-cyclic phosphodiesterase [Candidatus Dormibacteraceae bacterium]